MTIHDAAVRSGEIVARFSRDAPAERCRAGAVDCRSRRAATAGSPVASRGGRDRSSAFSSVTVSEPRSQAPLSRAPEDDRRRLTRSASLTRGCDATFGEDTVYAQLRGRAPCLHPLGHLEHHREFPSRPSIDERARRPIGRRPRRSRSGDDDAQGRRGELVQLSGASQGPGSQGLEAEIPRLGVRLRLVARQPALDDRRLHDRVHVHPPHSQRDVRVLSDVGTAVVDVLCQLGVDVHRRDRRQRRPDAQRVLSPRHSSDRHRAVQSRAVSPHDRRVSSGDAAVVPGAARRADARVSGLPRTAGHVHHRRGADSEHRDGVLSRRQTPARGRAGHVVLDDADCLRARAGAGALQVADPSQSGLGIRGGVPQSVLLSDLARARRSGWWRLRMPSAHS